MLKVAVAGSTGRMGRALIEIILANEDVKLVAALEQNQNAALGADAAQSIRSNCGVVINDDIETGIASSDVLIDFTRPAGTLEHLAVCRKRGVNMVIGTTGFDAAQKKSIAEAAREIAIVFAPNMSIATNLLFQLAARAAHALGADYDVEIIEAHHRQKVDAPSGTALQLGETIASALNRNLKDCAVYGRHGAAGARKANSIGFSAIRGGDIIGEHTVLFAGSGERLELTVRSSSRATYAEGALRAAHFVAARKMGLFDMQDVLDLR